MTQANLRLTLRHQAPKNTGRAGWCILHSEESGDPAQTGIIVVEIREKHWSWGASERVDILAPRIDCVLQAARNIGLQIIHAPSDTMAFYRDHPARHWVLSLPRVEPPPLADHEDPPLPIDDSDQGSDTGEGRPSRPWTRQHPAIGIEAEDAISDDGQEVYNVLARKGLKNLIFMGVHANMCVLNRPFAIKRMVRWGFDVVLARDLTDAMYNPLRPPYVSHDEGTRLVIEYIEKFWCPTMSSDDITAPREAVG